MKTRAIIIAAGKETRWENYKGARKHFVEIDGEPIIHRTVRLLREAGIEDIVVVGTDKRYLIEGSWLYIPKLTPEYHDADKFLSSRDLWLRDEGRTIVVYGDVYFTEKAIKTIVDYKPDEWVLFCRPYESYLTENGAECFAQSFYSEQIGEHENALFKAIRYYNAGKLNRIGGWEHYGIMIDLTLPQIHRRFICDRIKVITDWTDDFDTPKFYEHFKMRRAEHEKSKNK